MLPPLPLLLLHCTVDDKCIAGTCLGRPKPCAAPSGAQCVSALCDAATGSCALAQAPNGAPCNDGNPCTESDTCTSGVCGGVPKFCGTHSNPCKNLTCNPSNGICVAVNIPDGSICDDGLFCTVGDVCIGGALDTSSAVCLRWNPLAVVTAAASCCCRVGP